uniref:Interleukin n=1 Tax=Amphiprion percula TaxID=161767 RepID=A0A3P8SVN0_AMPPE
MFSGLTMLGHVLLWAKGSQFQLTCNLCRESHKTQVWLCFLGILFCCHYSKPQLFFIVYTLFFQNSDAMLYAPSINDIKDNCKSMSLKCYILELMMVMDEEEITEPTAIDCIFHFSDSVCSHITTTARKQTNHGVGCPPCESYSLKNITIFLDRLNNLLDYMTVWQKMHKT